MTRSRSFILVAAVAIAACGGDSDSSGAPDGGDSSTSCASTCAVRVAECGQPPGGDPCATLCAALTTASEVSCLASSSCAQLAEEFERGDVPCDGAGPVDEACELDDPPYCDGDTVVRCVEIGGMPATSIETCGTNEVCEAAECVAGYECLPLDARECSSSSSGPGACCDGTVCFGEIGPDGESFSRCCVALQSDDACESDADCCGHDPDATFTSRCIGGLCEQTL